MKARIEFLGNPSRDQRVLYHRYMALILPIALITLTGFAMTGCATPAPARPSVKAEIFRAPRSVYTIITDVAVGASVKKNVNSDALPVDPAERVMGMAGHDILNIRVTAAADGTITVAPAAAIMHADEAIHTCRPVLHEAIIAQPEVATVEDDGFLLLVPAVGILSRPQKNPQPPGKGNRINWLSVEATFLGLGIRYELDINDIVSIGGNVFYNYNFIPYELHSFGLSGTVRFFPGGSPFYLELGAGLGWEISRNYYGLMVTPAIGARLGGQTRGLFANPFISFPIIVNGTAQTRAGIGLGGAW